MFPAVDRRGKRVVVVGGGGQDSVDDDVLVREPDGGEFPMGAGDLGQRRGLRAGHQNQAGAVRVGQGLDRGGVDGALLLQSGQRSQTRGVALALVEEVRPGPRQLQQPDGVTGGGGVEQDMVVLPDRSPGVGQQFGELVEGGDLGGAGA